MRFPPQVMDDIRNRLPISQVVGRRVTFDRRKSQPAKGDFWACCPFHQEKSPSFHCDDRRGIYHCFGCGASGDHFKFVTETEGLAFPEAVERLAEEAGVALPKPDARDQEREAVRVDLVGAMEVAAKYYEARLRAPEGKRAREYLLKRAIADRTVGEFRIGYAPEERDALKRHLVQAGVTEEVAITAGLLIKPDDGRSSYDRFRGRVMIPIQDERGRVVAFGGRTLDPEGQPKYLNSPETPLFFKGTMLFNVHRAREAAHKSGTMIVTEGYLDAIAVFQAGIRNVVATLGTAFTEDQIARLWRFAPEPVICFDGDKAGVSAAHRAIDRILPVLKSGFSFNFCFLPDGKDPDDVVQTGGAEGFLAEVGKAVPLSRVIWERETASVNIDTPERKSALEQRVYDIAKVIQDPRLSTSYRDFFRVNLAHLFWNNRLGKNSSFKKSQEGNPAPRISGNDKTKIEVEKITLGLLIELPQLFQDRMDSISSINFEMADHRTFVRELIRIWIELENEMVASFYEYINPIYYSILDDVYGMENEVKKLRKGHKLRERLPILNFHPSTFFISEFFFMLVETLSLRDLKAEIEEEFNRAERGEVLDVADEDRQMALIEEHARRVSVLERQEHELDQMSVAIRKAQMPSLRLAA